MSHKALDEMVCIEQLINMARDGCDTVVIKCASFEECEHMTRALIDAGALHGDSGWSERILKGDHGDKWINPIITQEGYIEYCSADADLYWYGYIIPYENVYIECDDDSLYEAVNAEDSLNFLAAGGAYGLK